MSPRHPEGPRLPRVRPSLFALPRVLAPQANRFGALPRVLLEAAPSPALELEKAPLLRLGHLSIARRLERLPRHVRDASTRNVDALGVELDP